MKRFVLIALCGLFLAACAASNSPDGLPRDQRQLSGRLRLDDSVVLPEQLMLRISLYKLDESQPFVVSQEFYPAGLEIPFKISYPGKGLRRNAQVKIQAEVLVAQVPIFHTPEAQTISLEFSPLIKLERAPAPAPDSPQLQEVFWRLSRLKEAEALSYAGQADPHLIFRPGGELAGSDGCNNFFGRWSQSADSLEVSIMGRSLMLCEQGEEQGEAMLQFLSKPLKWQIDDCQLNLQDASGNTASFEAVKL